MRIPGLDSQNGRNDVQYSQREIAGGSENCEAIVKKVFTYKMEIREVIFHLQNWNTQVDYFCICASVYTSLRSNRLWEKWKEYGYFINTISTKSQENAVGICDVRMCKRNCGKDKKELALIISLSLPEFKSFSVRQIQLSDLTGK